MVGKLWLIVGLLALTCLPGVAQTLQVDLVWGQAQLPGRHEWTGHAGSGIDRQVGAQTASGAGLRLTYAPRTLEAGGLRLSLGYEEAKGDTALASENINVTTSIHVEARIRTEVRTVLLGAALATGGPLSIGAGVEGRVESIREEPRIWTDPTIQAAGSQLRVWVRAFLHYRLQVGLRRPVLGLEWAMPIEGGNQGTAGVSVLNRAPDRRLGGYLGFQF